MKLTKMFSRSNNLYGKVCGWFNQRLCYDLIVHRNAKQTVKIEHALSHSNEVWSCKVIIGSTSILDLGKIFVWGYKHDMLSHRKGKEGK